MVFFGSSSDKIIALTIDDSPTDSTEGILDELKRYGARATFFIISSQVHTGNVLTNNSSRRTGKKLK